MVGGGWYGTWESYGGNCCGCCGGMGLKEESELGFNCGGVVPVVGGVVA